MSRSPTLAHRAEYALFAGAARAATMMTERAANRLATALGSIAYRTVRIRRRVVEQNLRMAFPDKDEPWIRRTAAAAYIHLTREAVATLRASRMGTEWLKVHVACDGVEVLKDALARGRGVILLGGHVGNWELGAATTAALGFPIRAMVRRQKNPLFDNALAQARARLGIHGFDRKHGTTETLRALRSGNVVIIIADQDARKAGVFVPFFGRLASTARGPAVLALRARAPIVTCLTHRQPNGLLQVRYEAIDLPQAAAQDRAVFQLTAQFMNRLEASVRAAPEQYLWHHRRWKTAPPGPAAKEPDAVHPV
jgi:KDO2-lipid IV(A) lauroyltransferase